MMVTGWVALLLDELIIVVDVLMMFNDLYSVQVWVAIALGCSCMRVIAVLLSSNRYTIETLANRVGGPCEENSADNDSCKTSHNFRL